MLACKIGLDTAGNEPPNVLGVIQFMVLPPEQPAGDPGLDHSAAANRAKRPQISTRNPEFQS